MLTRPAVLVPGMIVLYVGLAAVFLAAMPEPRGPFEYLVAGSFATGICLLIGFGLYAKSKFGRSGKDH
jgi:hypothetical protein